MPNETFPWPRLVRPDYAGLRVVVAVPPAVEPVTLDEAKLWGNIQNPDDYPLVMDLIVAMRETIESRLGQAMNTQTRTIYLSGFMGGREAVKLPYPPLQSVSSVQYLTLDGNLATLDTSEYGFSANSMLGQIRLPFGHWWPFTLPQDDAVTITYTCGYGDVPADVPMRVRMAMRSVIAANYIQRESHFFQQGGQFKSTPLFDMLIDSAWHGEYR